MTGFGRDAFADAEQQAVLGWATTLVTPDGNHWQLVPRVGWLRWTGTTWQPTMPPMDPYSRFNAHRVPSAAPPEPVYPAAPPEPVYPASQPGYPGQPHPGYPQQTPGYPPAPPSQPFPQQPQQPQLPQPQQSQPLQPQPQQLPPPAQQPPSQPVPQQQLPSQPLPRQPLPQQPLPQQQPPSQPFPQPPLPQPPYPGQPHYQLPAMPAADLFAGPANAPVASAPVAPPTQQPPAPQQLAPQQPTQQQQPAQQQPAPPPAEPPHPAQPPQPQPQPTPQPQPAALPPQAAAPAPPPLAPLAQPQPMTMPPMAQQPPMGMQPPSGPLPLDFPQLTPLQRPAAPPLPPLPVAEPVYPVGELLQVGKSNRVFVSTGESVRAYLDRVVRVVKWSADTRTDPNREDQPNPILLLVGEPNSGQHMLAFGLTKMLSDAKALPVNGMMHNTATNLVVAGNADKTAVALKKEHLSICQDKKKLYLLRRVDAFLADDDTTQATFDTLTALARRRDVPGVMVLSGNEKFLETLQEKAPGLITPTFVYRMPSFRHPEVRAAVLDSLMQESGAMMTPPARARLIDYAGKCVAAGKASGSDPVVSSVELGTRAAVVRGSMGPGGRVVVDLPDLAELVDPAGDEKSAETKQKLLTELDAMIGLDSVKKSVHGLLNELAVDQQRVAGGLKVLTRSRHMVFTGNPGTAKTTVARLVARIYRALGLLSSGHVVECQRADMVGEYIGKTAPKTRALCQKARGGVLFIDEAYQLASGLSNDYGKEAIAELLVQMENHRDDLIVIAAGYPKEMDGFLDANPGLRSRFAQRVEFPDYSNAELARIYESMAGQQGYALAPDLLAALPARMARIGRGQGFANGRSARSLLEETIGNQSTRLAAQPNSDRAALSQLVLADLPASGSGVGQTDDAGPHKGLTELMAELDTMVGLDPVKQQVRAMAAETRLDDRRRTAGLAVKGRSRHLVFTGNPGTAKTTVARLVAQIYRELGALSSGHLIEATRPDFVGEYIGKTGPKTRRLCEKAMGGVLFIDEAYELAGGLSNDYGKEAIAELLVQMENHRDDLIVIAAGYPKDMDRFLDANSGLRSRFATTIHFPDYSDDELLRIAGVMFTAQGYQLDPALAQLLPAAIKHIDRGTGFANGRSVRGLVERMIERQSVRLAGPEVNLDAVSTDQLTLLVADDLPPEYRAQ